MPSDQTTRDRYFMMRSPYCIKAERGGARDPRKTLVAVFLLGDGLCRRAVGFGQDALYVFELDGGVEDVEAFAQDVVDAAEDGVAFRRRHVVDQDVAA